MVLTSFNLETNHHNHIPKYNIHLTAHVIWTVQATKVFRQHDSIPIITELLRDRNVSQIAASNHGLYRGSAVEWSPMREYSRNIRYIHFSWDDDNTKTYKRPLEWNTYHTRTTRHFLQPSTPHLRVLIWMRSNSLSPPAAPTCNKTCSQSVGNQILLSVLHKQCSMCGGLHELRSNWQEHNASFVAIKHNHSTSNLSHNQMLGIYYFAHSFFL
jgi:hypothetical protein